MPGRTARTNGEGPALSVVLPNYNHAQYLPRALDALLTQELPADEIIVVDDCSADASRDIVTRYAARCPSIRLVANEKNIGVIATLSHGLSEAHGQYIYFGAADDFVLPGFFAAAVTMLQAHPSAGLFSSDAILVDGHSGRSLGARPPVRPRLNPGFIGPSEVAELLRHNDNFIVTGAAVFRRAAVVSAGGFDEQLSSFADGWLVRKIALTSGFCYAPKTVLTWCVFPDSVSRTTSTKPDLAREILEKIETRLASDPVFPTWYRDAFRRRWQFATSRLAIQSNPVNRDLLMAMGARNAADRAALNRVLNIFGRKTAGTLIMAWLWWQFRPFSLTGLATTALARSWGRVRKDRPRDHEKASRPVLDRPYSK
jgi:glycosyltransferase involved in cell wall biosynthesis